MADEGKGLDTSGMEDLIQKMLEKYGESEEQTDSVMTSARMTSQDATQRTDAAAKEADSTVNDMIRRESPRWDKVYGTEDNHTTTSGSQRAVRREVDRRPTTSTEDRFTDYVGIGSVIRSQTGVAKQLINVSEGLDELNDDLEDMKRELKRIQTKAYTCLEGGDVPSGQTAREFASVGRYIYSDDGRSLPDEINMAADISARTSVRQSSVPPRFYQSQTQPVTDIYRGWNEWAEERQGVIRFDDGNIVRNSERYLKTHGPVPVTHLPGAGRSHIKESDIELTNLLTIAEPEERNWRSRSTLDDGSLKRERSLHVDRFGRPVTQYISVDESSSKHDDDHRRVKGSHAKPDGYCYMCEEFGDISRDLKSRPSYIEAPKVSPISHRYSPHVSFADLHQHSYQRSREDLGIYKSPSGVYFYSDDGRSLPDEVNMAADISTRTSVRQSSVPPRFFQSQTQPVASQRFVSPIHRPTTTGFTSRFLTKVRRRNSIGGRIDTDRYRGQTLRSY